MYKSILGSFCETDVKKMEPRNGVPAAERDGAVLGNPNFVRAGTAYTGRRGAVACRCPLREDPRGRAAQGRRPVGGQRPPDPLAGPVGEATNPYLRLSSIYVTLIRDKAVQAIRVLPATELLNLPLIKRCFKPNPSLGSRERYHGRQARRQKFARLALERLEYRANPVTSSLSLLARTQEALYVAIAAAKPAPWQRFNEHREG